MIGSVPRNDLLSSSKASCHHNSSFVRFGAAGRIDSRSQVTGQNFTHELIQSSAHFGNADSSVGKGKLSHLEGSSFYHCLWHIMSQVGTYRLTGPIQILLSSVVVEIDTFAVGHVRYLVSGTAWHPSHHERVRCTRSVQLFGRPGSKGLEVRRVHCWGIARHIVFGL